MPNHSTPRTYARIRARVAVLTIISLLAPSVGRSWQRRRQRLRNAGDADAGGAAAGSEASGSVRARRHRSG